MSTQSKGGVQIGTFYKETSIPQHYSPFKNKFKKNSFTDGNHIFIYLSYPVDIIKKGSSTNEILKIPFL